MTKKEHKKGQEFLSKIIPILDKWNMVSVLKFQIDNPREDISFNDYLKKYFDKRGFKMSEKLDKIY